MSHSAVEGKILKSVLVGQGHPKFSLLFCSKLFSFAVIGQKKSLIQKKKLGHPIVGGNFSKSEEFLTILLKQCVLNESYSY